MGFTNLTSIDSNLKGFINWAMKMQLKLQIQSTKKDSLSMNASLSKMKKTLNNLALARNPIFDDDLIMCVLQGVTLEYDTVVANINSQHIPLDFVHALLLNQEIHIQSTTALNTPSAHMVNRSFQSSKKFENQRTDGSSCGLGCGGRG